MQSLRKLLIVSRAPHYHHEGRFYAYTAYAREIDLWGDLFPEVIIAGPLRKGLPPRDCSPFAKENIRVVPVLEAGGDGFKAKIQQLFVLPKIILQLGSYMRNCDAIHVRCPCDLGLLGTLIAPLFSRQLIAKYAGQWSPFPKEPLAWRLQRAILCSKWWRGPVTVYSATSDQPEKVIPSTTSVLSDEDISRARAAAAKPRDPDSFRILFVGRLSTARNIDVLLRAVSMLNVPGRAVECAIVGEGPERNALQDLAATLGIQDQTKFMGGLMFDKVLQAYETADVLVLAAESEGWGKAVTEAMAFGCVCIGGERGMMPHILADNRGLLVPPRDLAALHKALQYVADHPLESRLIAQRAAAWAQKLSLGAMRETLRKLMIESWSVLKDTHQTAAPNAQSEKARLEPEPQIIFK